jgi:hypothetical protein
METVVLMAALGIAVLCGFLLLFWIISALRGKRSKAGRVVAAIVVSFWAAWQTYVLNPAVGTNLTYFVVPIAVMSVLLILSWVISDVTSEPPSEGPDVKIPSMAMRHSAGTGQELEDDEQKNIAVGE